MLKTRSASAKASWCCLQWAERRKPCSLYSRAHCPHYRRQLWGRFQLCEDLRLPGMASACDCDSLPRPGRYWSDQVGYACVCRDGAEGVRSQARPAVTRWACGGRPRPTDAW